ncbi:MAG: hypothetical protein JW731_07870 [Bacteroidales bacterium]|nr:hypothetical protein [Bacteroidales bacterium]
MKITIFLFTLLLAANMVFSQQSIQPLSKAAQAGGLFDISFGDEETLAISYGYLKKKETVFVNYSFDKDLKLLKEEESSEPKAKKSDQPSRTYDYIYTSVGGCSSFDILSMDLNAYRITLTETWNNKKQRYDSDMEKTDISKSLKDFNYKGYVGYFDAKTGSNLVLVKEKSKDEGKQYILLIITLDQQVKEVSIGNLNKYTLVYSDLVKINPDEEDEYENRNLAEYNALYVFAPSKNSGGNAREYVAYVVDGDGNKVSQTTLSMPDPATVITQMEQDGNDLYFFGMTSPDKASYYADEFMDFSNISNPCYPDFFNYRDNQREEKITKLEPDNLVMVKLSGQNVEYVKATSTNDIESRRVVPPSVKKVPKKDFGKFTIQAFEVFDNGDIIVAGQRTRVVMIEGTARKAYEDVTCFHFDNQGNVKAEYCIEPQLATQKDDKIFQMQHIFVTSGDKKKVYWVLYEPEGKRGYDSFFDAFNDRATYYASYQPEVLKIDLTTAKISDPELPLGKEYLSYSSYPLIQKADSNETIFLGRDRKNNSLGLTKYVFE